MRLPCVPLLHEKGLPGFPLSLPWVSNERHNVSVGMLRIPEHIQLDDDHAYCSNGVIASPDHGIFNVYMRGSVSGVLRVGGCSLYGGRRGGGSARVMIRGACTDCRAYRVTTRHTHTGHSHMRRCMSPPLAPPLINSQGLSAGRSGADSWMRLSGMPRYSVRASCLGRGWGRAGGQAGALAVFARTTSGLHVLAPIASVC